MARDDFIKKQSSPLESAEAILHDPAVKLSHPSKQLGKSIP
jgi:hypothetical protein